MHFAEEVSTNMDFREGNLELIVMSDVRGDFNR